MAADYKIDKEGQHAFVNFRIQHLGYSWLYGTFKDFDGTFTFDEKNPAADKVSVTINTNKSVEYQSCCQLTDLVNGVSCRGGNSSCSAMSGNTAGQATFLTSMERKTGYAPKIIDMAEWR